MNDQSERYTHLNCPMATTLSVLGDRWALLIVRDALTGISRFKDFQSSLGLSRHTLSRRLEELVHAGILQATPIKEGSTRLRYIPTEKCLDLLPVLMAMVNWGDKWYPAQEGSRIIPVDRKNSLQLELSINYCKDKKTAVNLDTVQFMAGPGADLETKKNLGLYQSATTE